LPIAFAYTSKGKKERPEPRGAMRRFRPDTRKMVKSNGPGSSRPGFQDLKKAPRGSGAKRGLEESKKKDSPPETKNHKPEPITNKHLIGKTAAPATRDQSIENTQHNPYRTPTYANQKTKAAKQPAALCSCYVLNPKTEPRQEKRTKKKHFFPCCGYLYPGAMSGHSESRL